MVRGEVHSLVPFVRVMRVLPQLRLRNMLGALISYHSLRVKGSMIFFLDPFLPFVRRLFLLHSAARVRTRRRSGGGIVHVLLEVLVETLTKVVHILHHSLQQKEDPWRRRRMLGMCRLEAHASVPTRNCGTRIPSFWGRGGAEHTNRGHVRVRTFHRATYSTEHAARPTEPSSLKIKVRVHPGGEK